jgi:hypothetical protein
MLTFSFFCRHETLELMMTRGRHRSGHEAAHSPLDADRTLDFTGARRTPFTFLV